MLFVLFQHTPGPEACKRWARAPSTSSSAGPPNGVFDHHEADVNLAASERLDAAFRGLRSRLLSYDIFPPRFLRFVICPPGELVVGSVIVQRVGFGPVALESAVRVVDVWQRQADGAQQAGFSYVTLAGHPECGAASFEVRMGRDETIRLVLEARSIPGSVATRLARPLARSIQVALTRAALRRLTKA
ncbi:MAG: DUF1990 domain-containing protein [Candidatus Dormibacteraeota bacterium]|nr:DUF1990 domain-containing protein [Candidatus Dormibacteraeota bacterium]